MQVINRPSSDLASHSSNPILSCGISARESLREKERRGSRGEERGEENSVRVGLRGMMGFGGRARTRRDRTEQPSIIKEIVDNRYIFRQQLRVFHIVNENGPVGHD